MNLEYFIADRMSRSQEGGRTNIMVRIAVLSVAVGMAAMIVTMAVLSGFKSEIERRITGFTGHVVVADTRGFDSAEPPVFEREERVEEVLADIDGFVSAAPFLLKSGMVRSSDTVEGLVLKGYDGEGGAFFGECLVEGAMPRMGDSVRYKDILISRVVADRLSLAVGDRVEMLFVDGGHPARRDLFSVSGIYASGMDESDRLLALTDIRNVRRLVDAGDRAVSGYEVHLDRLDRAEAWAETANERLLYDDDISASVAAQSIGDIYAAIFDWQKTHDVNAAVIIVLMLAVALFNTMSALLILVLERTRTIGVLKAEGMTDASLRRVFLYRAAIIVVRGVLWGDAAGIALCLLQKFTHAVKLDPAGYILSEMPVHIELWHLLALNAGAVAVIVAGLLIPARIVSSVQPEEAVRYE